MAERIRQINPECRVTVVDDFVTPDNVAQYMSVGYSYVIDAIDSVRPKAALIAYCRRNKIPLVTTGGAGGQIDPTQIQVTDLAKNDSGSAGGEVARAPEKRFWRSEKQ